MKFNTVEWHIERIKRVSKKFYLDPKVANMTLQFQRYEYGKNGVEEGMLSPDEFGIDCYFKNCHSLNIVILSGKVSGEYVKIHSKFDMEIYWHFYGLYHGKEQIMILKDGSIRKGEWPPLFMSDDVCDEFKRYRQERKAIKILRIKSNFESREYPYSILLHYSAIKPGMMVIEEDDCSKEKPIYFMCKVVESYRGKTVIDGKKEDCFVLHIIAYSEDGIEIYNWKHEPIIMSDITKEEYEDLGQRVYFKTIEEAKTFGINESELEEASFEYCLKNNKYF